MLHWAMGLWSAAMLHSVHKGAERLLAALRGAREAIVGTLGMVSMEKAWGWGSRFLWLLGLSMVRS